MEEDEAPCTVFSRRAKFIPKKTAEELQAALELVNELEEDNFTISNEESFSPNKKAKTKGRKKAKPKDIYADDPDCIPEEKLSAASKRKLRKFREEQDLERERIEAENERILSMDVNPACSIESIKDVPEDFEKLTVLTVTYMSEIIRLKCYENDKFLGIFPKVADSFNLKVTEFLLCFKERNITVDDSPKSLNITSQDVLECIPRKVNFQADIEENGNTFKISFQSNDVKGKTEMVVHKMEKMKDIMGRYSKQRNIPENQLIFDFDGERLTGDETPVELDMESENCIDVTVLVPAEKTATKKSNNRRKKKVITF